ASTHGGANHGRYARRSQNDRSVVQHRFVGGPRSQFAEGTTFPTIRYHLTVERLLAEAGIACDYVEAGTVADIAAALAARMDSQIAADGGPASPAKNDSASDVDTQPTPEEVIPVTLVPGETTR
ncbi:MAG: LacI family transcriptional regulator, partial [Bifidobacterium longum]